MSAIAATNAPKLRLDIAEMILEERPQFDRIRGQVSEGHTEIKGWSVEYLLSGKYSNDFATRVNPNPATSAARLLSTFEREFLLQQTCHLASKQIRLFLRPSLIQSRLSLPLARSSPQ